MAWLSVGTSNNDLIQKMIENGVFEEGPILEAFREGVSHGVEISESACQFSREKAKVWHAKLISKLKEDEESLGTPMPPVISSDGIAFVSSNCFDIDILSAVSTMKYDRIYVGAGCPESRKEFFLSMLADDGIMVAPINEKNQMIVIRKFCGRVYNSKPISQVNFAPLLDTTVRADEPALLAELASMESNASLNSDIQQTIQKVQAASASSSFIFHPLPFTGGGHLHHHHNSNGSSPSSAMLSPAVSLNQGNGSNHNSNNRLLTEETVVRVRLPALVWAPLRRRHLQFPPDFRRAVFTILLANNQAHQYTSLSSYMQYMQYAHHDHHQQQQQQQVNHYNHRAGPADRAWACLPHHIWLFIFTFASRDWFCVPKSEVQALSTELAVERRLRRSAEDNATAMEEVTSPTTSFSTSISTASMPTATYEAHYLYGNSSSSGDGGALAWQQAATNSPPVPAFAAPIVPPPPSAQDTYFHHNYAYLHNDTHYQYQQLQFLPQQHGNAGAVAVVAGSLSSDATCTTVESALSHNHNHNHNHNHPRMPFTAAAIVDTSGGTIIGANTGNNTSRASALSFSAEERISDCTDNGDEPHEEEVEGEGDGEASGFDSSEQFTTDELL
eukprot:gene14756-16922_t